MPNTIEWGTLLQNRLDQHMIQGLTSGWMDGNAGKVQYTGGKEIKIPTIKTSGLGTYGRNTSGYPEGDIDLSYKTHVMTQDRGREFGFDRHDVGESAFLVTAANVLNEFQTRHVIPEVDAYRYSTIAKIAKEDGYSNEYMPDVKTLITQLNNDIAEIADRTGLEHFVITMNRRVFTFLQNNTELSKFIDVTAFQKGGVSTKVKSLDENPIIPVSSVRMKSEYEFLDGRTGGQESGGFKVKDNAQEINWIICPQGDPLAVTKQDNVKIFTPEQNQDKDSWKLQYRRYHDLWVPSQQVPNFQVSFQPTGGGTRTLYKGISLETEVEPQKLTIEEIKSFNAEELKEYVNQFIKIGNVKSTDKLLNIVEENQLFLETDENTEDADEQ